MPRPKTFLHLLNSGSRPNKKARPRFAPELRKAHDMTASVELIRTFSGKTHGLHENKRTVVTQSIAWRCTNCGQIFLKKLEADEHEIHRLCKNTRLAD